MALKQSSKGYKILFQTFWGSIRLYLKLSSYDKMIFWYILVTEKGMCTSLTGVSTFLTDKLHFVAINGDH